MLLVRDRFKDALHAYRTSLILTAGVGREPIVMSILYGQMAWCLERLGNLVESTTIYEKATVDPSFAEVSADERFVLLTSRARVGSRLLGLVLGHARNNRSTIEDVKALDIKNPEVELSRAVEAATAAILVSISLISQTSGCRRVARVV